MQKIKNAFRHDGQHDTRRKEKFEQASFLQVSPGADVGPQQRQSFDDAYRGRPAALRRASGDLFGSEQQRVFDVEPRLRAEDVRPMQDRTHQHQSSFYIGSLTSERPAAQDAEPLALRPSRAAVQPPVHNARNQQRTRPAPPARTDSLDNLSQNIVRDPGDNVCGLQGPERAVYWKEVPQMERLAFQCAVNQRRAIDSAQYDVDYNELDAASFDAGNDGESSAATHVPRLSTWTPQALPYPIRSRPPAAQRVPNQPAPPKAANRPVLAAELAPPARPIRSHPPTQALPNVATPAAPEHLHENLIAQLPAHAIPTQSLANAMRHGENPSNSKSSASLPTGEQTHAPGRDEVFISTGAHGDDVPPEPSHQGPHAPVATQPQATAAVPKAAEGTTASVQKSETPLATALPASATLPSKQGAPLGPTSLPSTSTGADITASNAVDGSVIGQVPVDTDLQLFTQFRDFAMQWVREAAGLVQPNAPTVLDNDTREKFAQTSRNFHVARAQAAEAVIHDFLFGAIENQFAGHEILSEFTYQGTKLERSYRWLIAPLDGRANMAAGGSEWSIALTAQRWVPEKQYYEPVAAVVHAPEQNLLVDAVRKLGTRINGSRVYSSSKHDLDGALIKLNLEPLNTMGDEELLARYMRLLCLHKAKPRDADAPALQLASVAVGAIDAAFYDALPPWSWLPGKLMIEEAGGRLSRIGGGQAVSGQRDILAVGNPRLRKILVDVLTPQSKDRTKVRAPVTSAAAPQI